MNAHQRARRSRGQALVELALVLPVLLILMFGVIEFGRFMFAYATLNNAIREGSRYAIVHGSTAACPSGPQSVPANLSPCYDTDGVRFGNIQNAVRRSAFTFGQSPDLVVDVPLWPDNTNDRGWRVIVSASYTWRTLIPLVPLPPITMQASSTDVINY